jgi:hypothetical protein
VSSVVPAKEATSTPMSAVAVAAGMPSALRKFADPSTKAPILAPSELTAPHDW